METQGIEQALAEASGAFQPVLQSLENVARSEALTVVSRQPSQLTSLDTRLRRLTNLLKAARQRARAICWSSAPNAQILAQMEGLIPEIKAASARRSSR
jgi:hypothetical protein